MNGCTYVDVVFDGPPDHEAGRFVEVEKADGSGVKLGNWVERGDGYWALRVTREDLERALYDTEPTEAEVDVAYAVWSRDFMAKPMREILHDILKAAKEAHR